jgi:hypothetical protein
VWRLSIWYRPHNRDLVRGTWLLVAPLFPFSTLKVTRRAVRDKKDGTNRDKKGFSVTFDDAFQAGESHLNRKLE